MLRFRLFKFQLPANLIKGTINFITTLDKQACFAIEKKVIKLFKIWQLILCVVLFNLNTSTYY